MNEIIRKIIKDLLEKVPFHSEEKAFEIDDSSGSFWFRAETNEPRYMLGRDGDTLMALNHLARKIVEKNLPEGADPRSVNVVLDLNDFQKKRVDNLRATAHMMAERARFFKSYVEVDPMSSYERRIIHDFLSGKPDIKTESVGNEPNRRVVIRYI